GGEGDIGVLLIVVLEHPAVVHFVDVVAGKNDDMRRLLAADRIDVLVNRVGGAHVPVAPRALGRRQQLVELAEFLADDAGPSFADVAIERERLVLSEDVDPPQAGVDAVGEGDVDDAIVPAERHGRLSAVTSQGEEPLPGTSSKQNAQCIPHVFRNPAFCGSSQPRRNVTGPSDTILSNAPFISRSRTGGYHAESKTRSQSNLDGAGSGEKQKIAKVRGGRPPQVTD